MTQPPSAAALSSAYQSEQERAIRHLSAAGSDITAEATRYLLRLLDDARRVAAERAKPAASDHEAAWQILTDHGGSELELEQGIAAALAERGERERERAAKIIPQAMRPFLNACGDGIIDGMLDECEEAIVAAIRNQTLTGD